MSNRIIILQKLRDISQSNKNIGAFTSSYTEFNNMLAKEDTEIDDLASVIEKDPMLSAAILKGANSSMFGLVKKVTSIKQAVSVLGFSNIKKIFNANMIKSSFKTVSDVNLNDLWKHSLGTAIASQILAERLKPKLVDEAFLAGLIHDLGSFIVATELPEEYEEIVKKTELDPNKRLLVWEKEIMGVTHQEIGAYFGRVWNFPDLIIDCIKHHHYVDQSDKNKTLISIVMLANNISKGMQLGSSMNYYVEPMPKWIWSNLGLKPEIFRQIIPEIQNQFDGMLAFIE